MRHLCRSRHVTVPFLVAALATQPAGAEEPGPHPAAASNPSGTAPQREDAKDLFDQGQHLFDWNDFPLALEAYRAALLKVPDNKTAICNIGEMQRRMFRYFEALDSLQKCIAELPPKFKKKRSEFENVIAEIQRLVVVVELSVTPAGAQVTLDGEDKGRAPEPPALMKLPILRFGRHVLEVQKAGWEPQRIDLSPALTGMRPSDHQFPQRVDLVFIPTTRKVLITSAPAGALVKVDGKEAGRTPLEAELALGSRNLEASLEGHYSYTTSVALFKGEDRQPIQITLIPLPPPPVPPTPLYKQWWPWTAGGVVVVAGSVIGGILGYQETHKVAPMHSTIEDVPLH